MYEAVHAVPDGESTVSRFAVTAAEYGYDGIVVRNHGDAQASYEPGEIRDRFGVDVVTGVEIRAGSPEQAAGYLGSHRPTMTVVVLHGGTEDLNRFGVGNGRIDVLAHPMGDADLDHVLVRRAAEHGVRLELNFGRILRDRGGARTRAIARANKLRELIEKYDAPYVVSADPASHLELRAPKDLAALGATIGFTREQIGDGLQEWRRLAERNRDRHSSEFIEPGVSRRPAEGDDG